MAEISECYEILGCKYGEQLPQVKKKFMSLALKFHPDKGGDKAFFDLLCKSYKKIRQIRKFEDLPDEDVNYSDDIEVSGDKLAEESFFKILSIIKPETKISPGYEDYSGNKDYETREKPEYKEYDANDLHIKYQTPVMVSSSGVATNELGNTVNHKGRDTDVSGIFQMMEYGKFGTEIGSKGVLGCYDLGDAMAEVKVIPEPLDNQTDFETVNDKLETLIESRENMDNALSKVPIVNTTTRDYTFERENDSYGNSLDKAKTYFMEKYQIENKLY